MKRPVEAVQEQLTQVQLELTDIKPGDRDGLYHQTLLREESRLQGYLAGWDAAHAETRKILGEKI